MIEDENDKHKYLQEQTKFIKKFKSKKQKDKRNKLKDKRVTEMQNAEIPPRWK